MTDDLVHVRALTTATGLRTRTNMLNASMRKQNYKTSLLAIDDNSGVTQQLCSQQQSTRQVYRQLFASHNLGMHTCRHTLLRFAHLRLHSLPSMLLAAAAVVLVAASSVVRGWSIGFWPGSMNFQKRMSTYVNMEYSTVFNIE